MLIGNIYDGVLLALLLLCVIVWPTQFIADRQNRWLRLVAVMLVVLQLVFDGPRLQLLPAYFVAGLYSLLLIARKSLAQEPSSTREDKESIAKKFARWATVLGTGILLLLSIILCVFFPRFEYPNPSGKYVVGVKEFHLTDSTRMELDTIDPNDYRELPIRVSYPASIGAVKLRPDCVVSPMWVAARYALMFLWRGDNSAALVPTSWSHVCTNAWKDAPIANAPMPFPVLIYSHGLGSWPEQNTILVEELASNGYVVVVINHPGLSAGAKLSNGTSLGIERLLARSDQANQATPFDADAQQASRKMQQQLSDSSLSNDLRIQILKQRAALRPKPSAQTSATHRLMSDDQRFVLNHLEEIQRHDSAFKGRLDLERIGVFGMSSGGTAAHLTCTADDHCRAGLNLDGFQTMLVDTPPLRVPFMHMSDGNFFNHIIPHTQSVSASYLIRITGSEHGSFTDAALTAPMLGQLDQLGIPVMGSIDGIRMHRIINAYTLAFFNKHLLGESQSLLDKQDQQFQEVIFSSR